MTEEAVGTGAAGAGRLGLIVFSPSYERVHYALAIAAAALASGRAVTLFFAMGACRALEAAAPDGRPGWTRLAGTADQPDPAAADAALRGRGLGGFEELLAACVALGAGVMVCEMGLRALDLAAAALRTDVPVRPGGLVTLLGEARPGQGDLLFI